MKRTPLHSDAQKRREFQQRAQRNSKPKRGPVSPASPEQRAAIKGRSCIVTGHDEGVTPTHLIDRSLGGCDDALCVVPVRADVHRAYDLHAFDLLPYLEAHGLRDEIMHAVGHLGLIGALERITNVKWQAEPFQQGFDDSFQKQFERGEIE